MPPPPPSFPSGPLAIPLADRPARLDTAPPAVSHARRTALIVACALFMQNLDGTVVSTALPAMAHAFGADPVHMNVALTSYLVSLSMFIPVSGWMADRFGARHVFGGAIAVFTIGSILCGRADTLSFLIGARVLQGAGGAMMVPVGRLVLLRTAARSELVSAMAWLSAPALIGPVLGPPIGGFLTTYLSWRWIFDINVPVGLLGIVLVYRYVPEVREGGIRRLDVAGFLLTALSMATFMAGLETIGRSILPAPYPVLLLATGTIAGLAYVRHARRLTAPLLDFGLLRIPTFMVSVLGGTLFRVGVGALPFLLPLMLQLGFGMNPLQSGLVTLASAAGAILMKPAATITLRRFGFRDTLLGNGLLAVVTLAACALFRPAWPLSAIYGVLLAGGLFRSLQFTAYNTVAYADIPRPRMSAATSLYATIQQLSLTLGVTAGAAGLRISMTALGHARPANADFSFAFALVGAISFLAVPCSLLMTRAAGGDVSGHDGRTPL